MEALAEQNPDVEITLRHWGYQRPLFKFGFCMNLSISPFLGQSIASSYKTARGRERIHPIGLWSKIFVLSRKKLTF